MDYGMMLHILTKISSLFSLVGRYLLIFTPGYLVSSVFSTSILHRQCRHCLKGYCLALILFCDIFARHS